MSGASCGSCGDSNNSNRSTTVGATATPATVSSSSTGRGGGNISSSSSSSSNNAMVLPDVVPEVFQIGCVVSIESAFNERFNGEVIAFDDTHKALLLKSISGGGDNQRKTTDVRLVNLLYVSKMIVEREAPTNNSPPLPPPQVNIEKVKTRMKKHVDERRKMASAIAKGVSYDGLGLFLAIRKTIEEVTWQDKDIIVMSSVRIQPPYRPQDCVPSNDSYSMEHQSVAHIRNIVEKHLKDNRKEQESRGSKDGPAAGL